MGITLNSTPKLANSGRLRSRGETCNAITRICLCIACDAPCKTHAHTHTGTCASTCKHACTHTHTRSHASTRAFVSRDAPLKHISVSIPSQHRRPNDVMTTTGTTGLSHSNNMDYIRFGFPKPPSHTATLAQTRELHRQADA